MTVTTPGGTGGGASYTPTFTITSVVPGKGGALSQVTLGGKGFNAATSVRFGTATGKIVSHTDTSLVAQVPVSATSGRVALSSASATVYSAVTFQASARPGE